LRVSLAVSIAVLVTSTGSTTATPLEDANHWLEGEAIRAASGSVITAHNGIRIYTPDGSAHYQALWTRDFYYLLEGCPRAVPIEEAEANFKYLLIGQRTDGAMPDRVQADGLAVYLPGPVGNGIGKLPATDNPAFMVKIAQLLCERRGDYGLYLSCRDALAKGLDYPKKSPDGLLWIDPAEPHSSYGFFDTIMMTGELFFTSVLQWDAYRAMAQMDKETGFGQSSLDYTVKAKALKNSLQRFWDSKEGMFRAATADCNQIDIWGSVYAVYTGLADKEQSGRIAKYLIAHHAALMQRGQLRHCAPGEYWQRSLTPKDQYQNGGYWATPFGWWFVTIHPVDPSLAERTFIELVEDFRAHGINEWVLGEKSAVPDYVASACQPLVGMRRCGNFKSSQ
jgi:hypothetical protein